MTTIDLLSKKDLEVIHGKIDRMIELLEQKQANEPGEWLRSAEVKKILKCGDSTLTGYRTKGILPHSKVGGVYYYRRTDIDGVLRHGPTSE
jgi:hypothetical protein